MSRTPGPWRNEPVFGSRDGAHAIRAKGEGVAIVTGRSITIPRTDETVEANARLIAAAPELLEVLKQAGILINSAPEIGIGRTSVLRQIAGAIAKAEGK